MPLPDSEALSLAYSASQSPEFLQAYFDAPGLSLACLARSNPEFLMAYDHKPGQIDTDPRLVGVVQRHGVIPELIGSQ